MVAGQGVGRKRGVALVEPGGELGSADFGGGLAAGGGCDCGDQPKLVVVVVHVHRLSQHDARGLGEHQHVGEARLQLAAQSLEQRHTTGARSARQVPASRRPVGEIVIGRGVEAEAIDPEALHQAERSVAEPGLPALLGQVEGLGVDAGELARSIAAEPLRVLGRERVDLWRALDPVRREIDDVLAPRPPQRSVAIGCTCKDVAVRGPRRVKDAALLDPCQGGPDRAPI